MRILRLALACLLGVSFWQTAEAINDTDTCTADSQTLSGFIACVDAVPEYARQTDGYSRRIRELVRQTGINRVDAAGQTPLGLAAGAGIALIVAELLALGADPNLPNAQDETPLMLALKGLSSVDETRIETLELLLARGARVAVSDKHGKTPLMLAAQVAPSFKVEVLQRILSHRPPVWALDKQGEHVLFYLARSYSPGMESEDWIRETYQESLTLLLAYKPDLGLCNRAGQTVAELARQLDFLDLAERLEAIR